MSYGGASRSPAIRGYLDQKQNAYAVGNRYGAAPSASPSPAPMSPGMGSAPAAPTSSPGRMPTPSYQMQGGTSPTPITPSPGMGGGLMDRIRRPQGPDPYAQMVAGLDPRYQQLHADYTQALWAGPDYKGRNEAAQQQQAQFGQLLNYFNAQPDIDFSGSSGVADQFNNSREQMQNQLAARGISGSGVEAGAMAASYGGQAKAMGSFYRDAIERRRQEEMRAILNLMQEQRGVQNMGLQRNWAEQDDSGFLGDALGVLGGVAGGVGGFLLGGPAGAAAGYNIGGNIGDRVGGNSQAPPNNYGYGNPSMYGPQNYPPVDWSDPYASGGY